MAKDLTALAQDPNAICVKITTIWGSGILDRNGGCEVTTPVLPLARTASTAAVP